MSREQSHSELNSDSIKNYPYNRGLCARYWVVGMGKNIGIAILGLVGALGLRQSSQAETPRSAPGFLGGLTALARGGRISEQQLGWVSGAETKFRPLSLQVVVTLTS